MRFEIFYVKFSLSLGSIASFINIFHSYDFLRKLSFPFTKYSYYDNCLPNFINFLDNSHIVIHIDDIIQYLQMNYLLFLYLISQDGCLFSSNNYRTPYKSILINLLLYCTLLHIFLNIWKKHTNVKALQILYFIFFICVPYFYYPSLYPLPLPLNLNLSKSYYYYPRPAHNSIISFIFLP